ncbi:amidohydrolase [uncultured Desulfobulbus sp.]|uniref:amidohydrolase family protein n=1 Tax=uncultured Desulfobulbus sp. TaxID=239745 RepID=UPI0029C6D855|nr:amidohydrolase [uncultured Desulfobulbus sp.]
MKIDLLITNCAVLPVPGRETLITPGFVAIGFSKILLAGPMAECPAAGTGTVLDGQGQLALPGLVNGHCHAPMTLFRGLADDLDLATWLYGHIFPAEARQVNPEMVYWCSKLAAAEMLLSGTTTVADGYFLEDEVARACAETGLRCVAAQAVIDFPAPGAEDPKRNIEVAACFLERWQGRDPLITPAVFAHSPYTCTNTTLRRAKELTRKFQVPFFIHAAETKEEHKQIAEPLAPTPIGHLEALGILDRDTVCAHCVWANERDLDCLAERGASVVTCPQSNAKLASGQAPLTPLLQRGLRVALGTDSAASNNSLDLFREMDFAAKIHKINPCNPVAIPARRLLEIATWGGADALALGAGQGTLTPGAPADLILVDLQQPHLQPFHSPNLLVYSRAAADVRTVIVNGQLVVANRKLLTIDLRETCRQVRKLAGG